MLELIKDGGATASRYSSEILRFRTPNVVVVFSNVDQRIDGKYLTSTKMDLVPKKDDRDKNIIENVIVSCKINFVVVKLNQIL